jgi:hypothetical protein
MWNTRNRSPSFPVEPSISRSDDCPRATQVDGSQDALRSTRSQPTPLTHSSLSPPSILAWCGDHTRKRKKRTREPHAAALGFPLPPAAPAPAPAMAGQERRTIDLEEGWAFMQKGITKLKNILEGKPEPQFSSEDYMMLYTFVLLPSSRWFRLDPLRSGSDLGFWAAGRFTTCVRRSPRTTTRSSCTTSTASRSRSTSPPWYAHVDWPPPFISMPPRDIGDFVILAAIRCDGSQ